MYIGPWQEYNLSRVKSSSAAAAQAKRVQQEKLKRDLQQALASTLDPRAAQAALQAMETVLQRSDVATLPPIRQYTVISNDHGQITTTTTSIADNNSNSNNNDSNSNRLDRTRHSEVDYPRRRVAAQRSVINRRSHELALPPLPTRAHAVSSAREREREPSSLYRYEAQAASPLSVRSSKSEPLRLPSIACAESAVATQVLPLTQANLERKNQQDDETPWNMKRNLPKNGQQVTTPSRITPTQSQHSPHTHTTTTTRTQQARTQPAAASAQQPAYDAAAMVSFLKMQRNSLQAKAEINRITGWRGSHGDASSASSDMHNNINININCNNTNKKTRHAEDKEKKLEQVQQMKEMYLRRAEEEKATQQRETSGEEIADTALRINKTNDPSSVIHDEPLSPIRSPRVVDKQITEEDLLRVSKYFKALESKAPLSHDVGSVVTTATTTSISNNVLITVGSLSSALPTRKRLSSDINDDLLSEATLSGKQNASSLSLSRHPAANGNSNKQDDEEETDDIFPPARENVPYYDDFNGGIDSLLNWTKELNFDDL